VTQPLLGTVDDNGFVWTVPRQNFVKLYVATGDAKSAARDAKLPDDDKTSELLEHVSVKAAIAELHEQVLRRIHESEDTVLSRYSNIAEGNLLDYIDFGDLDHRGRVVMGNIKPKDIRMMPRHMQQRVKKFKISHTNDNTNFEIELHDPMRANEQLAKLLGLDGTEQGSSADFAEQVFSFLQELDGLDENYEEPASKK